MLLSLLDESALILPVLASWIVDEPDRIRELPEALMPVAFTLRGA